MNTDRNPIEFVKETAKYFMDFLETDFHKHRNPKRSIKLRNKDNLLIGLNLSKYPSFFSLAHKAIDHKFDPAKVVNEIRRGVHRTQLPSNLLSLTSLQIDRISDQQLSEIIAQAKIIIENNTSLYKKEYDRALSESLDGISELVFKQIALPLIDTLAQPLRNLNVGDEETLFLLKEELTEVLLSLFEDKIFDVVKHLIAENEISIEDHISQVFSLDVVQSKLRSFFESFKATDMYSEIFEMERNRSILDKQEFYFYFYDISFRKVKYPIFYIPISITKHSEGMQITFDSQVFINKKALEFIAQEYNAERGTQGRLTHITDRIIYLADPAMEDFTLYIKSILNELSQFFNLDKQISFNGEKQSAKSSLIKITNDCYISLFDNSDEALVNDYEEILQDLSMESSELSDCFNVLIDDFIQKNPKPYNRDVENAWDQTSTSEKLVYQAPIPLNSEQRQILSAINREGCKYITAEGPPGTGKSHTITAIVCDAILNNKSVLVLSDKKEALDVVEDKITNTMNNVRIDKNFQNPILRLGKAGNTYNQILSTSSFNNIRNHYRAAHQKESLLDNDISSRSSTMKAAIDEEIAQYSKIQISEINKLIRLEHALEGETILFNFDELADTKDAASLVRSLRSSLLLLKFQLFEHTHSHPLARHLRVSTKSVGSLDDLLDLLGNVMKISDIANRLKEFFTAKLNTLELFNEFSDTDIESLINIIANYDAMKKPIIGYLFCGKKLKQLNEEFKMRFPYTSIDTASKSITDLKTIINIYSYANDLKNELPSDIAGQIDYLKIIHAIMSDDQTQRAFSIDCQNLIDHITKIKKLPDKYPELFKSNKINVDACNTIIDNSLTNVDDELFDKQMEILSLRQNISEKFKNIPETDFLKEKSTLEDLVTTKMTLVMDSRLVDFYENNRATAKVLQATIKKKQKFPREEFSKLKEAFPCILSGIRDYSDYIPLEPDLFDIIIIDEASQVSIAQAFPALLRGKKIVVFGDKKQFSNVKASHARTDANRDYLTRMRDVFINTVSDDQSKLIRMEKFNIKTSVLEFFEYIINYGIQLQKYFRGYKEIISYSNRYFYSDSLQVMKIRGKPIDDVLKFTVIEHDGQIEPVLNTNSLEIEYIQDQLRDIVERGIDITIGIITPHTNQQKLLMEHISKMDEYDTLFDDYKLKIMTFDTCQGEERDVIFYSMVATKEHDRLWGIFIKDLSSVDIEEEGKIKAQRLNVGFSRAKECMHFVLSKNIDQFNGSIGEAIRHYTKTKEDARQEKSPEETDQSSPMESHVLNWFYQSPFYKEYKDQIEFMPQFKLGEYLKQLDKMYKYPAYIVDFLLIYIDNQGQEKKIVIEYDGFYEHFKNYGEIDETNYSQYYSDDDVYRQKVLSSYGYEFLRINKFNLGKNPISTLSKRLYALVKKNAPSP